MAKTILGNLWQSSLRNQTNSVSVHRLLMKGLGDYITSNVTFMASFSGSLIYYPFTPLVATDSSIRLSGSPVSSYTVSFQDPAGGPIEPNWMSWMRKVYAGIRLAPIIGPTTVPVGAICGFSPMINPSFTNKELKSAFESCMNDDGTVKPGRDVQGEVLDKLATCVMKDMRSMYIPSFSSTYMTSYMGISTVTRVVTP